MQKGSQKGDESCSKDTEARYVIYSFIEIQFLGAHVRISSRKWKFATLSSSAHCRNSYHKRKGSIDGHWHRKNREILTRTTETLFHGDIINSDAIEGLQDIMEASRKRAASNVSQISSSQQLSPTKKTQHGRGRA